MAISFQEVENLIAHSVVPIQQNPHTAAGIEVDHGRGSRGKGRNPNASSAGNYPQVTVLHTLAITHNENGIIYLHDRECNLNNTSGRNAGSQFGRNR